MAVDPPGSVTSGVCYIIGALNFLIGSVADLPTLESLPSQYVSSLTYTFGSVCFALADIYVLLKLIKHNFSFIDRMVLLSASVMYIVGSMLYIPAMEHSNAGAALFMVGSFVIVSCRVWLYWKTKFRFEEMVVWNLVFEMGGAFAFLVGTIFAFCNKDTTEVVIYILGSCSFTVAAVFNLTIELRNRRRKSHEPLI